MKGDPQVIVHLNAQLKNELTATNQYFLHYRMLKHWGFDKLAKKEYEESIGEMKHADRLMERIFMLDGLPNLQDLGKLLIGENVPEILDCDLQLERGAQGTIKDGIAHCESVRDYVSRDILQESAACLRVAIVPPCGWTDLGTPERVTQCLASLREDESAVHTVARRRRLSGAFDLALAVRGMRAATMTA